MPEPDDLTRTIAHYLEVDWQYYALVEEWNTERVAEIRAAGRKAGRLLGYKIITRQSKPEYREDRRIVVAVVVAAPPTKEDHKRMEARARLLMDDFWSRADESSQRPE